MVWEWVKRLLFLIRIAEKKNISEKKRKCWSPAFSPFPTMFSKHQLIQAIKTGEGLLAYRTYCEGNVFFKQVFDLFSNKNVKASTV